MRRTLEWVLREYDRDKYGPLAAGRFDSLEAARLFLYENSTHRSADDPLDIIWKGAPLTCGFRTYLHLQNATLRESLVRHAGRFQGSNFFEAGCGIGYNLLVARELGPARGGDLSDNACAVARRHGLTVETFNFLEPHHYEARIAPETVLFTVQAIEQLPDATPFLENLRRVQRRIRCVVHLEPFVIAGGLGNAHIRANDYNTNLFDLLCEDPEVEILEHRINELGFPHHTSHVVCWKFR